MKEELFTQLYLQVFPKVAKYIKNQQGDFKQAQDVFQEALLVYYEKVIIDGYQPESNHKAYIFGIVKNMWLKNQQRAMKTEPLSDLEISETSQQKPISEKLLTFLQKSGEKCMNLLQSFYYEKLSMQEISSRFGFKSERSATVQKYKCLQKVKYHVKQKSLTYADFLTENEAD